MNTAYIGKMQVSSKYPIIVYGDVRGLVSEHNEVRPAYRSLKRDREGCQKQRGYSDAAVYYFKRERWIHEDHHDVQFDKFSD